MILVVGIFGISTCNLFKIQLIDGEEYKEKAEGNQLYDTEIAAERGLIYDSNGTVLAQSSSVWKVFIRPHTIKNEEFKADLCAKLSDILGVDVETIKAKADRSDESYLTIKKQITLAEKEAVSKLMTKSEKYNSTSDKAKNGKELIRFSDTVGIDPDVKRYYPGIKLASTILGFTNYDGLGQYGIESKYDTVLSGVPGRLVTARNSKGDVMSQEFQTIYDATQGTGLVLTIDEVIQRYLEDELRQSYEITQARGVYGVAMDVDTGAILAMVSLPDYDPNSPDLTDEDEAMLEQKYADIEKRNAAREEYKELRWQNSVVSEAYEPGSVFKIITAAAALEEGVATLDTKVSCGGSITVAGVRMSCHKEEGHGDEDFTKGLMNSCNPYFITIGQKLGKEKFSEYYEAFGFTEKTEIDLPAEFKPVPSQNGVYGTYYPLESMGVVELASSSFGQSINVSPIQLVTAISAIANGGKLMTPYVVGKQLDADGNVISETEPTVRRQVISEETAKTLAGMMEMVVSEGTGKNGYVPGYRVAGKTGTSQKDNKNDEYIASFGCFAPANDPEIAVLIVVDEPVGAHGGSAVCAPIARRFVEKTLEYMNVERQYTEKELAELDTTAPNLVGKTADEAVELAESKGLKVKIIGDGEKVVSQIPEYNQTIPQEGIMVVYTESDAERLTVTVPDLRQMTLAQANKYAASAGLNIKISGNALNATEIISYDQDIAPGETVDYGETITVYFISNTNVDDYAE